MGSQSDRNRTTAEWADSDYILPAGLVGYDTDTNRHKYGNGVDTWSDLPYPNLGGPDGSLLIVDENGVVKDLDGNTVNVGGGSVDPEEVSGIIETKVGELVPDNRLLPDPSGASIGDLLTVPSPSTPGWMSPSPLTKYRGAWGPDEELFYDDFADGLLAPWVNYQPLATAPSIAIEAMTVNAAANKPAFSNVARMGIAVGTSGQRAGGSLPLSTLSSLTNKVATKVKMWAMWGGTTSNRAAEIMEGESVRANPVANSWTELTFNLSAGGVQPLNVQIRNTGSGASNAHVYLTGVRVYGATSPYLRGDVVDHLGSFYRSEINNNPNTPGVGNSWTLIVA